MVMTEHMDVDESEENMRDTFNESVVMTLCVLWRHHVCCGDIMCVVETSCVLWRHHVCCGDVMCVVVTSCVL